MKYRVLIEKDRTGFLLLKCLFYLVAFLKAKQELMC